MSEPRLIKKYANRRLYDASQSRHITLDDIRRMVVAGERVKVVEDKTEVDITRLILLQVIADQEQFGRPTLSTPLLESLIRFYGSASQSLLSAWLEKSVETFMHQQRGALARMASDSPWSAMSELTRQNLEMWTRMQESMLAAFAPPRQPAPRGSAGEPERESGAGNGPGPSPTNTTRINPDPTNPDPTNLDPTNPDPTNPGPTKP